MRYEQLIQLARNVNALLSEYIAIHDLVFKLYWRRVIPIPGIFKKIDFLQHALDVTGISRSLQKICEEAKNIQIGATDADKIFSHFLLEYSESLNAAVTIFSQILFKLKDKATSKKYDKAEYQNDLSIYELACETYVSLGQRMNIELTRYRSKQTTI